MSVRPFLKTVERKQKMELMILDGNSIVYRAYYGIRMLNAPDGTPTNGIYGFLTMLNKLLEEQKPDYLCVAFDMPGPTFRHKKYQAYKAQRKPMPDELAVQIPLLKEVLDALGVKRLELDGYEADDIIGTVSRICESGGCDCLIVTGDKDSFQLISGKTSVLHVKSRMGRTETICYTPEVFTEEYSFEPRKIIDLKALMGDPSDNIPGVKGIGEKTAMKLIQGFGGIDHIYRELSDLEIKDSLRTKLREGEPDARISYNLAEIITDLPIDFSPKECTHSSEFTEEAYNIFRRLGFNSLIEKWDIGQVTAESKICERKPTEPRKIKSPEELKSLLEAWSALPAIAIITVGGSLDELQIFDGETVFEVNWSDCGDKYNAFLKELFSESCKKISHDNKDFYNLLLSENLPCDGFIFDTALAAYLLSPTDNNYKLTRISTKYLGGEFSEAEATHLLYPVLKQELENNGMSELYYKIELPLCHVLADMERAGFAVDKQALHDFGGKLSLRIDGLRSEIWELAGEEFNINSPKQLGEVLFDKLMLPGGKKTKTGWSTNADVLNGLHGKHPIIEKALEYRQLAKLKSTYTDGLLKVVGPDMRLHTNFQMTVTATGRLSSTEPNLQNIPIRTELGSQIREMFIADNDNILVDADYSQIELRLLAHISSDETMINAFLNGEDIHAVTASQVFGVPLDKVTSLQRSRAKAVNFGIVYGISAFSLAQDIGVFTNEAKAYIDAYLSKYHGVRDYMTNVVEEAKSNGYVTTLFGRMRPLPELKSPKHSIRQFGERAALNTPIQGTAADIIKLAMVNVHSRLKEEGLEAKLILQVHDELLVECPPAEEERVKLILVDEMQNVAQYSTPLTVDVNSGKSWSEAK